VRLLSYLLFLLLHASLQDTYELGWLSPKKTHLLKKRKEGLPNLYNKKEVCLKKGVPGLEEKAVIIFLLMGSVLS
jgi:hypothetical protein